MYLANVVSTLDMIHCLIPTKKEVSTIIIHIFQVRRLKQGETYVTCQGHSATKLSPGLEPGS